MFLVDEDTRSFNAIMESFALPNDTIEEKQLRASQIESTSVYAAQVPLRVIKTAMKAIPILKEMVTIGNPNSITDAGVGALCIAAAVEGAGMNVRINAKGLKDAVLAEKLKIETLELINETKANVAEIIKIVELELK